MPFVSHQTAEQLRQLIAERRAAITGAQKRTRPGDRLSCFVRCTSATAADTTGVGAQCYPGIIVDPQSDQTTQPTLGEVWLTLLTTSGAAGVPTAGRVYESLLAGDVEAATGDTRPRAFAGEGDSKICCPPTAQPATFALSCGSTTSDPDTPTKYAVIYRCADLAVAGQLSFDVYAYDPGIDEPCTYSSLLMHLAGDQASRFLSTASISYYGYCCPEADWIAAVGSSSSSGGETGVEGPRVACIQLLNGTRSYAPLFTPVSLPGTFNGLGYPINYTTPNGKMTVAGSLVMCVNRSPAGFYFKGKITSKVKDPTKPTEFLCGCDTEFEGCTADTATVKQEITSASFGGSPAETLKLTTPCGTLEIKLAGSYPCSPPPPPATYNCLSGRCVEVLDGTGTFSSLALCLASGCTPTTPVTYNCVSGRCVDPLDGTGTFTSLDDCLDSPCVPAATYSCVPDGVYGDTQCSDPTDGSGTYTGAGADGACVEQCVCCGEYFSGKTATFIVVAGYVGGFPAGGSYPADQPWYRNANGKWECTCTDELGTTTIVVSCGDSGYSAPNLQFVYQWQLLAGGAPIIASDGTCGLPSGPAIITFQLGSVEVIT